MVTKEYGLAMHDINWSCPAELEPYKKAHEKEIEEKDFLNWQLGQYFAHALDCTVCNSFLWRKKGEKAHAYISEPFSRATKTEEEISEDELRKQRELFVAKLQIMKTNFELRKEQER